MADFTTDLRAEIASFLADTGMSPSYFGFLATGNSKLVERLEGGRTVTLPTAEKVRSFIAKRRKVCGGPVHSARGREDS